MNYIPNNSLLEIKGQVVNGQSVQVKKDENLPSKDVHVNPVVEDIKNEMDSFHYDPFDVPDDLVVLFQGMYSL